MAEGWTNRGSGAPEGDLWPCGQTRFAFSPEDAQHLFFMGLSMCFRGCRQGPFHQNWPWISATVRPLLIGCQVAIVLSTNCVEFSNTVTTHHGMHVLFYRRGVIKEKPNFKMCAHFLQIQTILTNAKVHVGYLRSFGKSGQWKRHEKYNYCTLLP